MSAQTTLPPTIPAADVLHPHWCEVGPSCRGDLPGLESVEHLGPVTAWKPRTADSRPTLRLARSDDHLPAGQQALKVAELQFVIEETGAANDDGSPIVAETFLDVAELDQLIRFLQQHRDQMVWSNTNQLDMTSRALGRLA